MTDQSFRNTLSLVVVANEFPDREYRAKLEDAHPGEYFRELYLRWRDLFDVLPAAKNVAWHEKIDFPDAGLFYKTMRLVVEADSTPPDLYMDIVAMTEGLTLRWSEFINFVTEAERVDWNRVADRFRYPDELDGDGGA
ncbi:MAG: hypothetical protein MAG453_01373 [Calditrichaeota bacterium]|nr:hypothetical protein [Calditrichota bacterium]